MVCVASKGIFGDGIYSVKGSNQLRVIGRKKVNVSEIRIARPKGGMRMKRRGRFVFIPGAVPPFLPRSIRDPYHPSQNSLCYMIQTAHLMGAGRIYAMGFTFESGTPYAFGRTNPATKQASFYDAGVDMAMAWLRWYEASFPGKVRLLPGWAGPVYQALQEVGWDELQSRSPVS